MQSLTQHTTVPTLKQKEYCVYQQPTRSLVDWHAPQGVSVVDGGGETPGPIPNPEAKPARADGTALGRVWESRLPPTQQLHEAPRTPETPRRAGCFLVVPRCVCMPLVCLYAAGVV